MTSRAWLMLTVALASGAASLTMATPARALTNCINDRDCPAATPACNGGVCAECTQSNQSKCAGTRTPTCLPQGICGCTSDGQCGAGLLCNAASPPYCTAGCTSTAQCPSGYTCSSTTCQKGCDLIQGACSTNPPYNVCKGIGPFGLDFECLECTANSDCASKAATPICNTTTHTCVQCNNDNDCTNSTHGKTCIAGTPRSSCGCNNDSNCAVGQICDGSIKACVDGCRTSTGARCPPGNQCRADGCVPIDGGTGGQPDAGNGNDAGQEEDAGDEDAGEAGGGGGHRRDAGSDAGEGGGLLSDHPDSSLEGGGWSCSMTPSEDVLPIGGLFTLGGLAALFARRRRRQI